AGVAVVHPQPAGGPRAATGAPAAAAPCRRRRRSRRRPHGPQPAEAAPAGLPLPGIAHRLGFGRPASRLPQPPRPPGNRGIPCPRSNGAPAPAPRANASPRLPAAASVYTIDSDLTSEIDPLYSAIRRHSGAGQDEPATATPTPVARRRHAVEPPQQQQHVYASICKTLPSSLNNTADSASSDAAAAARHGCPGRAVGQQRRRWGRSAAPPAALRNYRREEVDRILQEPAPTTLILTWTLPARVGGRCGDAGANLRQQQQQPILRPILNDLRPELAAAPADGEYQRVTVRESLASLRARNALPMTAGRPASAAAAATASQQRPLHLSGRLAGQARARGLAVRGPVRCRAQRRWRQPGETRTPTCTPSTIPTACASPHPTPCPPWSELSARRECRRSARRWPLAARRRAEVQRPQQPGGGGSGFNILNEMQNFRHMDSDG
uniref:Velvet domain-containing protein n=1 Tax=Macrostomum lignano TaxID=282301 RepID=A0A1I8FQC4_9PLAT